MMADTLLALVAAHLIADFPAQGEWLLRRKKNPLYLLLHIAIVIAAAILVLGAAPWPLLAILAGTHLVMDALKVHVLKDTLASFLIDQFVHLAVILGLGFLYPDAFANGFWARQDWLSHYQALLCLIAGTILSLHTGAILIKKITAPFVTEIGQEIQGLSHGGTYIGCLERALVMLLMLINQPAGVGFLITAKSILRFGDVKESAQRKLTEYIIIGTFLSFGWGLLVAALTQVALAHWAP
ncbi:hypothetical protein FHS83_001949 [Rhizomicrobium palustre]|uniref:DUF3307 domain-containing protein n=1 Tax=Rhizomicrobium palustre TaxID=189966 RepID=A0A846MZU8_9PROT|nr:DUF3307 domain-containing protein [Rhizomicrobium palustre]NIK88631.1 hypothetical protein [Rhizomicrobium palustre]